VSEEPRKRGRKPSPEKREAILAAALKTFAGKGVEASTTRQIAELAETTERTLFKHFGSKDALVRAVIEKVSIESMRDRAFARVHEPHPFTREEFVRWHRAFLSDRVEGATAAPDNYRVVFRELLRDDVFRLRFVGTWLELVYAPLVGHLKLMQDAGEIGRAQTPEALAGTFFSLNLGYLLARFTLAPEMTWRGTRDVEAIVELFVAACGRP
jgi:AcrR family transcriptional regulator